MSGSIASHRRLKKRALPRLMQGPFPTDGGTFCGGGTEPQVDDMLRDPIIAMVMYRDHVTADDVLSLIRPANRRL